MSIGSVEEYKQVHQQLEQAVQKLKVQAQGYETALSALKDISPTSDRQAAFQAVTELGVELEKRAKAVETLVETETEIIQTYKTKGWRKVVSKLGFSVASLEMQQALRIHTLAYEVRQVAHNTQVQLASGKITNTSAFLGAYVGRLKDIDQSWPQARLSWKSYFAALFKSIGSSRAPPIQSSSPGILTAALPRFPSPPLVIPKPGPLPLPPREQAGQPPPAVASIPPKPEPSVWSKEAAMWNEGMNWLDEKELSEVARGKLQSLFEPAMRLLGPRQGEITLKHLRDLKPAGWQQLFTGISPTNYESAAALRDFLLVVTSASSPLRKTPSPMPKAPTAQPSEEQQRHFLWSIEQMADWPEAKPVLAFLKSLSPQGKQALLEKMIQQKVTLNLPYRVLDFLQVESLTEQSAALISSEEERVRAMLADKTLYEKHLQSLYERVECAGTGNCMYEAFARGLGKEMPGAVAEELRQELYEYMSHAKTAQALRDEPPERGGFGSLTETEFAQELAKVKDRQGGVEAWADTRHVRVLAQKHNVRVHVHMFCGGKDVVSHVNPEGKEGADIHLFFSQRHYDYMKPLKR